MVLETGGAPTGGEKLNQTLGNLIVQSCDLDLKR